MKNHLDQFYHKLLLKKVKKISWSNLYGSAIGLAVASLTSKPLVVITKEAAVSFRLEQEVRFFLGSDDCEIQTLVFPSGETLPYDHFSPHEEVISQRLLALYRLTTGRAMVVFIDVATLMQRLPPRDYIESNSFILEVGEELDFNQLRSRLLCYSYNCVAKVMEHGEFAIRGSIIDIFPMGSNEPYRIDLLHTTVDSIRVFDVDTQRSSKIINSIKILPAREFALDDQSIDRFSKKWCSYFTGNPWQCPVYESVNSHRASPGIEAYLPLFFAKTASFFDYLTEDFAVVAVGNIQHSMREFWQEVTGRYEQLRHDQLRPILAPQEIFISPEQIEIFQSAFPQILINDDQSSPVDESNSWAFQAKDLANILGVGDVKSRLPKLENIFRNLANIRWLFVVTSIGRQEALLQLLHSINIFPVVITSWQKFRQSADRAAIAIAPIEASLQVIFTENNQEILLLTESDIYGEQIATPRKLIVLKKIENIVRDLTELKIGDPVVHIDHGVGRYLGLQKLLVNNSYEGEFLVLEYAASAKLYVPVTSLGLISRYTGADGEHVPLNHLGSSQWGKIKSNAEKRIRDTACELLEIYAKRQKSSGFSFTLPDAEYQRFARDFPFLVTRDQERAINDVLADMTSGRMMDRLICGDVGFGKTEVAMRGAFLAANNGKQVAILAPTTLLAQQHFNNFQDRFAAWPIKIALLSRLRGAKELAQIVKDLADGKVDIVIGTHKLLQDKIHFKNLGLLVVDEEHRFGVRHKEYIKKLASQIDILTLTATPIPRTLNMAFAGIRDFSIISTPPAGRLSIKTFICEYDPYLIKEAMLRETLRGGQVYFLHNNISTIDKTARELQPLIPGARIAVAHGAMPKQQLESIMRDFYYLRINILVCTTIIESGIDVPAANTIIIDRADTFGLAQLHQLRGRVGRSHHQAYAYLLVTQAVVLAPEAKKRLAAIEAMKDLGTGFALAINDLEIRGAGELLGEKQSGIMQGIGFNLYMEMLKRAVKSLRQTKGDGSPIEQKIKSEIDLQISALLPDQYVNDVNLRLVMYKKIAEAKGQDKLDELQAEVIDRFGRLPSETKNLFAIGALKLKAQDLGIVKITLSAVKGRIEFSSSHKTRPECVIQTMKKYTTNYKVIGSNAVEFTYESKMNEAKTTKIEFLANMLAGFLG